MGEMIAVTFLTKIKEVVNESKRVTYYSNLHLESDRRFGVWCYHGTKITATPPKVTVNLKMTA